MEVPETHVQTSKTILRFEDEWNTTTEVRHEKENLFVIGSSYHKENQMYTMVEVRRREEQLVLYVQGFLLNDWDSCFNESVRPYANPGILIGRRKLGLKVSTDCAAVSLFITCTIIHSRI